MSINCNKCDVQEYCGTMVASTRLCPAAHPEWWSKKEKEKTATTTRDEENKSYEEMNALYG